MNDSPLSRLRRLPPRGTTPAAGQSPFRGVCWRGLLRGLLTGDRGVGLVHCSLPAQVSLN